MYIKDTFWLSEVAKEAEVIISDDEIDLVCFSHPFNKANGEVIEEPLYCVDARDVVLADEESFCAIKTRDEFGYKFRGILTDSKTKTVRVNNITLSLIDAEIPKDIPDGAYIEFCVTRLDLL